LIYRQSRNHPKQFQVPKFPAAAREVLPAGLRLTLHPAQANAGELAVAAVDEGGTAQLFRGLVRPGFLPGQPALMLAHPEGPLSAISPCR
jgi:hypothetical protein